MVTNHNLIILFSFYIVFVQTVALPDEYTFSHLTVDQETGLIAVSSEIYYRSDTMKVFALYQSDPCLQFQQLLEVCISKIIIVTLLFFRSFLHNISLNRYLINKLSFTVFRSRSQCLEIPFKELKFVKECYSLFIIEQIHVSTNIGFIVYPLFSNTKKYVSKSIYGLSVLNLIELILNNFLHMLCRKELLLFCVKLNAPTWIREWKLALSHFIRLKKSDLILQIFTNFVQVFLHLQLTTA